MSEREIRLMGGPLDGQALPWVRGYWREGDIEYIDGRDRKTGRAIQPALYKMHNGALHFVGQVEPVDSTFAPGMADTE